MHGHAHAKKNISAHNKASPMPPRQPPAQIRCCVFFTCVVPRPASTRTPPGAHPVPQTASVPPAQSLLYQETLPGTLAAGGGRSRIDLVKMAYRTQHHTRDKHSFGVVCPVPPPSPPQPPVDCTPFPKEERPQKVEDPVCAIVWKGGQRLRCFFDPTNPLLPPTLHGPPRRIPLRAPSAAPP